MDAADGLDLGLVMQLAGIESTDDSPDAPSPTVTSLTSATLSDTSPTGTSSAATPSAAASSASTSFVVPSSRPVSSRRRKARPLPRLLPKPQISSPKVFVLQVVAPPQPVAAVEAPVQEPYSIQLTSEQLPSVEDLIPCLEVDDMGTFDLDTPRRSAWSRSNGMTTTLLRTRADPYMRPQPTCMYQ